MGDKLYTKCKQMNWVHVNFELLFAPYMHIHFVWVCFDAFLIPHNYMVSCHSMQLTVIVSIRLPFVSFVPFDRRWQTSEFFFFPSFNNTERNKNVTVYLSVELRSSSIDVINIKRYGDEMRIDFDEWNQQSQQYLLKSFAKNWLSLLLFSPFTCSVQFVSK